VIIRILKPGTSFKGLAYYLMHDPKAKTDERVAWTDTLNLAHDHIGCAVDEMYTTYANADILKEEAGVRAGGRKLQYAVKHLSLSWPEEQRPDAETMRGAVKEFLTHMGWQDHQAILVAHNDKPHRHVHVMLNAVHPGTGLKLDEGLERRRAQAWALKHEKEGGKVYCYDRLLAPERRTRAPTRNNWDALRPQAKAFAAAERKRRSYNPAYLERRANRRAIYSEEWDLLKARQRAERDAFFANGKLVFGQLRKDVYRAVREEFRAEWGALYAAKRDRIDPVRLSMIKADLELRQKAALKEHGDAACNVLRAQRDKEYELLLRTHRAEKAELKESQTLGLSSPELLWRDGSPLGLARDAAPTVEARVIEHGRSPHAPVNFRNDEWKLLRQNHRAERVAFHAQRREVRDGLRAAVARTVREKLRDAWSDLYAARRAGNSRAELVAMRADIFKRQSALVDRAMDETGFDARMQEQYAALQDCHGMERAELRRRQERGLSSVLNLGSQPPPPRMLDTPNAYQAEAVPIGAFPLGAFRRAAKEVVGKPKRAEQERERPAPAFIQLRPVVTRAENPRVHTPVNTVGDLGLGALGALTGIVERLFDGFMGGAQPRRETEQEHAARPHASVEPTPQDDGVPSSRTRQDEIDAEAARMVAYWNERRSRSRDR
jgi:hypothetical protein